MVLLTSNDLYIQYGRLLEEMLKSVTLNILMHNAPTNRENMMETYIKKIKVFFITERTHGTLVNTLYVGLFKFISHYQSILNSKYFQLHGGYNSLQSFRTWLKKMHI